MADFSWTTGGEERLTHVRVIARSDIGQVHEVSPQSTSLFADVRIAIGHGKGLGLSSLPLSSYY